MSMQGDVKSARRTSAGSFYPDRTRLRSFSITPTASTASTIEFRNGSATGTILCQMDVPSNTSPYIYYISIPNEGVLFDSGIYLTFSVGSVTAVTIFYG
jgi:hypothetical protein